MFPAGVELFMGAEMLPLASDDLIIQTLNRLSLTVMAKLSKGLKAMELFLADLVSCTWFLLANSVFLVPNGDVRFSCQVLPLLLPVHVISRVLYVGRYRRWHGMVVSGHIGNRHSPMCYNGLA